MSAPPVSPGSALVRLHVVGDRVATVAVSVDRPAAAARKLLSGKTPAEALKLVPLLFAVCGTAQAAAAAAACEQAMGLTVAPAQAAAREILVAAESLNGHVRFMTLDWPKVSGAQALVETYAGMRWGLARLPAGFYPDRDAFALGGGRLFFDPSVVLPGIKAASAAMSNLLGLPDNLSNPTPLDPTPAPQHLLRDRDAAWFTARLADDPAFAERPDDDGVPALNAPLAEFVDDPSGVGNLLRRCGLSPVCLYAGRIAGAMAELNRIVDLTGALGIGDLSKENLRMTEAPEPGAEAPDGVGCAVVRTARGALAHRVRIENGRIADWRAVAPTEWNFHPDGPLKQALTGAAAGPDLLRRAEELVCALDPCVPWRVEIIGGDGHA